MVGQPSLQRTLVPTAPWPWGCPMTRVCCGPSEHPVGVTAVHAAGIGLSPLGEAWSDGAQWGHQVVRLGGS